MCSTICYDSISSLAVSYWLQWLVVIASQFKLLLWTNKTIICILYSIAISYTYIYVALLNQHRCICDVPPLSHISHIMISGRDGDRDRDGSAAAAAAASDDRL
jgi:hypothetical protein